MEMRRERLFSLDLLWGLDMFLLVVIGRLIWTAQEVWDIPVEKLSQFEHAYGGFTFWDIIMPLFLFMCGAAIPFALPKRLDAEGRPTAAFYPYSNTLQTIAAGYVIAALALIIRRKLKAR